jgi:hypothetical protein
MMSRCVRAIIQQTRRRRVGTALLCVIVLSVLAALTACVTSKANGTGSTRTTAPPNAASPLAGKAVPENEPLLPLPW